MRSIDFNFPLRDLSNQPVLDAQGHPLTMGSAAVSLLQSYQASNTAEAHTALALAQRILRGGPATGVQPTEMNALKKAIAANAAHLPAVAVSQLAKKLGIVGCHVVSS
jgi:hypothetical protein